MSCGLDFSFFPFLSFLLFSAKIFRLLWSVDHIFVFCSLLQCFVDYIFVFCVLDNHLLQTTSLSFVDYVFVFCGLHLRLLWTTSSFSAVLVSLLFMISRSPDKRQTNAERDLVSCIINTNLSTSRINAYLSALTIKHLLVCVNGEYLHILSYPILSLPMRQESSV